DGMDLVLADQPLQEVGVEDVADERREAGRAETFVERLEIERDDVDMVLAAEMGDESMADLAVGAGNQDDGFTHGSGLSFVLAKFAAKGLAGQMAWAYGKARRAGGKAGIRWNFALDEKKYVTTAGNRWDARRSRADLRREDL